MEGVRQEVQVDYGMDSWWVGLSGPRRVTMRADDKPQLQAFCRALPRRLCREGVERPLYQELSCCPLTPIALLTFLIAALP